MPGSFVISLIVVVSAYFWWTFKPSKRPNVARFLPPGTIPRFLKQDDTPSTASKSAKKKKQKKKANKGAEASSGAESASLRNENSTEASPAAGLESHSEPASPHPGNAKQQTPIESGRKGKQNPAKASIPALAVSHAGVATAVPAQRTPVSPDSASESRSDRGVVRVPDLDADDDENPQYARVLKVNKTADELSASEVELDDGWRMVDVHSKPKTLRISGGTMGSTSKPASLSASKQPEGLTKKQRENQRKAEKKKAAKAALDSETEARLRDHRRAQMHATLNEAVKTDKAKAMQKQLMKNYEPAQARQAPSRGSSSWYAADDDTAEGIWD
ncbi:hypothetical protein BJ742DRAFT_818072 [Cladochytrium replicatum]|nr:hypothetical protein BJ742DRAFT_818072 [Cladochytrium replicatum]